VYDEPIYRCGGVLAPPLLLPLPLVPLPDWPAPLPPP